MCPAPWAAAIEVMNPDWNGVPHCEQDLASVGFSVPQFGHFIAILQAEVLQSRLVAYSMARVTDMAGTADS